MNTFEQTRKSISGALLQDMKQHKVTNVQALLDGGIKVEHLYDQDGQPTPLSALYEANVDLFLGVALNGNPQVDAQQAFGLIEKNGHKDWAKSYQNFFYSMNGDGSGFQPDKAIPIILEEFKRNRSIRIASEARLRIEDGEDPAVVNNDIVNKLLSIDSDTRNQEVRSGTALEDDLASGVPGAIPTGCEWYDTLCGGVYTGQIDLLVGASGQGKSSMAVDLAASAVRYGRYVVFVEEEMSGSEMRVRIACNLAEVQKWQMRDYGKDNWPKLFEADEPLGLNPDVMSRDEEGRLLFYRSMMDKYLRVYSKSGGGIRNIVRRHRAEWGTYDENGDVIPILVIWDHMGHSVPEGSYNTSIALKIVAADTVSVAADEQVSIISFSQPGAETRKHLMKKGFPDQDPQAALSAEIKNACAHFTCFVRDDGKDKEGRIREDAFGKNLTKFFLVKDRFLGMQNILTADYSREFYRFSIESVGVTSSGLGAPA